MSLPDHELEFIQEAMASANRQVQGLLRALPAVQAITPLSLEALTSLAPQKIDAIDLMLKRFENVFEAGRRLFRAALLLWEEPQDGLSYIDVLNRLEKIGILESAQQWREVGRTRNAVVHEYAMRPDDQVKAINAACAHAEDALKIVNHTLGMMTRRIIAECSPR